MPSVELGMGYSYCLVEFYEEGVQKLVPRYDKYFINGGEYVEK